MKYHPDSESLPEFLAKGRQGEEEVARRLVADGARILERGYRRRCGEIDLIAEERTERGTELVFIEVRVRTRDRAWVSGVDSVDARKRLKIERVARIYLRDYRGAATHLRFDIAAFDGERWEYRAAAW